MEIMLYLVDQVRVIAPHPPPSPSVVSSPGSKYVRPSAAPAAEKNSPISGGCSIMPPLSPVEPFYPSEEEDWQVIGARGKPINVLAATPDQSLMVEEVKSPGSGTRDSSPSTLQKCYPKRFGGYSPSCHLSQG